MVQLQLPANKGWHRGFIPGQHRGQDFGHGSGRQIYAALAGTVIEVYAGNGWNGGWGNRIVVQAYPGVQHTYSHIAPGGINVSYGDELFAGQHIATMGSTGDAPDGDHLHFELYLNGTRVDPEPYYTQEIPGTPPTKLQPNQRTTGGWPVAARTMADLKTEPFVTIFPPGTVINCVWWQYGDGAGSGNDIFFLAKFLDGRQFYVHSGDVVQSGLDGIPEYPGQKVTPPNERTVAGWPTGLRAKADLAPGNIIDILNPGAKFIATQWEYGDDGGAGDERFLLTTFNGKTGYIHIGDTVQATTTGIPDVNGDLSTPSYQKKPASPDPDPDPKPEPEPEPQPEPEPEPQPEPEPEPEPQPEPEPEIPVIPVPERPDVELPDTTEVNNLVKEAASNIIVSENFRSKMWAAIFIIGVVLLGILGWFAGIKQIPPEWVYGVLGVAVVVLPLIALIARANMPSRTLQTAKKPEIKDTEALTKLEIKEAKALEKATSKLQ